MNYEYQEMYEMNPEYEGEFSHEMHENELAHELLGVQNEQEFEYFLGNLLKSAWSGAKALYNSPVGQQIKGQVVSGLKSLGKRALPGLGRAVGGRFFGDTGARFGGQLGNMAVRGLGLEFEGAGQDDRRFEAARRLVRVAKDASRRIAAYAQGGNPMNARIIRRMIMQAASRHYPGLMPPAQRGGSGFNARTSGGDGGGARMSGGGGFRSAGADDGGGGFGSNSQSRGSWYKQGNRIILQGV